MCPKFLKLIVRKTNGGKKMSELILGKLTTVVEIDRNPPAIDTPALNILENILITPDPTKGQPVYDYGGIEHYEIPEKYQPTIAIPAVRIKTKEENGKRKFAKIISYRHSPNLPIAVYEQLSDLSREYFGLVKIDEEEKRIKIWKTEVKEEENFTEITEDGIKIYQLVKPNYDKEVDFTIRVNLNLNEEQRKFLETIALIEKNLTETYKIPENFRAILGSIAGMGGVIKAIVVENLLFRYQNHNILKYPEVKITFPNEFKIATGQKEECCGKIREVVAFGIQRNIGLEIKFLIENWERYEHYTEEVEAILKLIENLHKVGFPYVKKKGEFFLLFEEGKIRLVPSAKLLRKITDKYNIPVYELYEIDYEIGLQPIDFEELKKKWKKKIKELIRDRLHYSEEYIKQLVEKYGDVKISLKDSIEAGNCPVGTRTFAQKYGFNEYNLPTIKQLWEIAQKDSTYKHNIYRVIIYKAQQLEDLEI
jgi:hypothetical protein